MVVLGGGQLMLGAVLAQTQLGVLLGAGTWAEQAPSAGSGLLPLTSMGISPREQLDRDERFEKSPPPKQIPAQRRALGSSGAISQALRSEAGLGAHTWLLVLLPVMVSALSRSAPAGFPGHWHCLNWCRADL